MKPYLLGLYEKSMPNNLSWKEKLVTAKESGYDFVEISIDESDEKLSRLDYSKDQRFELIKTMNEVGIPIRTMCLSGHRKYPLGSGNTETHKKSLEIMEKAIELAYDLGVRIIQIAGYDVYYEESNEETKGRFIESLKQCVLMAASKGVILAFETMETEFMNTVYKAMQFVNKINSPYLNVYPDCGNITNAAKMYGIDVIEDLRTGAGHITSIHLKETVPGKFREISFGTGHVDFNNIISTGLKLGVRLYVTEFWYTNNDNWKEVVKDTNKLFRKKFDLLLK